MRSSTLPRARGRPEAIVVNTRHPHGRWSSSSQASHLLISSHASIYLFKAVPRCPSLGQSTTCPSRLSVRRLDLKYNAPMHTTRATRPAYLRPKFGGEVVACRKVPA